MLVVRAVEGTWRQQDDCRLAAGRALHGSQGGEQCVGVVLDRRHAVIGEEVGREPHHDLAVLEHVGDARGGAHIVFENVEILRVDPHYVDPGDVHVDVVWHGLPEHLLPVRGIALDHRLRNDAGLDDLLLAVDVRQKPVERRHPLHEPGLEPRPFAALEHPRDDVERDQSFGRVLVAVDVEGDADPPEHQFGMAATRAEEILRRFVEPTRDPLVGSACLAAGQGHLVEARQA